MFPPITIFRLNCGSQSSASEPDLQACNYEDRGDEQPGDARQNDVKPLRPDARRVIGVKIRHACLPWLPQTLTRVAFRGSTINCD